MASKTCRVSLVASLMAIAWGGAAFAQSGSHLPPVYTLERILGPYHLDAASLQQMPAGFVPVEFEEPVWVVGYSTEITSSAETPSRELHCHTMMMGRELEHAPPDKGQAFKGVFSDGYTPKLVFPPGYGLHFDAGEPLSFMPMFNNRAGSTTEVSMRVRVDFVRAEEAPQGLIPLYSAVVAIRDSHLYMVPPGVDVREKEFRLPYKGTIRAMGVHIHPYGRSIELINKSRDETVWNATGTRAEDGRLISMPFFSKPEGYSFGPDDELVLRATYDNPTDVEQDAMAGLFIFFSTEDGQPP